MLTSDFPELWPFILGGLFVAVVLLFPDGLIGIMRKVKERIGTGKAAAPSEGKREGG